MTVNLLELLKQNAPYVYKSYILKHPEKRVINTEQTEIEDDFIKGLEEDKEKLKNVIPF